MKRNVWIHYRPTRDGQVCRVFRAKPDGWGGMDGQQREAWAREALRRWCGQFGTPGGVYVEWREGDR